MVLEMAGWWPYSCFIGCCFQDFFTITCSILVQLPSSFFSICAVSVHVVHPYSRIDMTAAWKKLRFILLNRFYFHMTDDLSIAVQFFIFTQLNVKTVLFQTIQFTLSTQFKGQKQFYFKLFSLVNKSKWFQILLCITNSSIKHQS